MTAADIPMVAALVVIPLLDVVATGFFLRLYLRSKRAGPASGRMTKMAPGGSLAQRLTRWLFSDRSWLLLLMTFSNVIITAVFLFLGWLAVRRLLGESPFPWAADATLVMLLLLGLVPIIKMAAFWRARRRSMPPVPPPFGEKD